MDAGCDGSDTWFRSFFHNISILSREDGFRQFLDESTLPLPFRLCEERCGGLPGTPSFEEGQGNARNPQGVGGGVEDLLCQPSPTVAASSPGYEQSFFPDFESNSCEKTAVVVVVQETRTSTPDFNGSQNSPRFFSPSNELHSVEILDAETAGFGGISGGGRRGGGGGLGEGGSNFSHDSSLGSRHLPLQTSNSSVNCLSGTSAFASSGSLVSSPMSGDLQRIPVPCEKSSLFNVSPSSPSLTSPATISKNLRIKAENCDSSRSSSKRSELDVRKERRRQQNRTAARRCRDRKKESLEGMIKTMEAANVEKEQYQRLIVRLKTHIHLLTQELRKHQLQCGLDLNSFRFNSFEKH